MLFVATPNGMQAVGGGRGTLAHGIQRTAHLASRPTCRIAYLSLIVIRVLLMAVPTVFVISITPLSQPLSLFFWDVRMMFLALLVGLSLTLAVCPGGMLATPEANLIRPRAFTAARSLSQAALRGTNTLIRLLHFHDSIDAAPLIMK